MTERVKNFLRGVEPWQAIVAALTLLVLVLLVAAGRGYRGLVQPPVRGG